MKKVCCLILILAAAYPLTAAAASKQSCEQRKAAIQRQMSYAKKYNNSYELAGLERALNEVKRRCTDTSWRRDDDIRQKERKVKALRRQLERAEADLKDARG